MAQVSINSDQASRKMIFPTELDAKKAVYLTFIAFLFTGFQCAIYGMLTVPISAHFALDPNRIIFFDGFGLWGQILAMATGGMVIRRIKGKNTLILAAVLMILGSLASIFAPNVYLYTLMVFICNMAVGYVLVSCNYMIMGTVNKEGQSQGRLSLLNVFFSLGFLVSAPVVGSIILHGSWQMVFVVVMVLFVLFIAFLLSLRVDETVERALETKRKSKGEKFITPGLALSALALFLIVYVEQIMNYFNQPHLHYGLKLNMQTVGFMVSAYTFAQLFGRAVFGKFLLPRVKTYKYIVSASLLFALVMVAYLNLSSTTALLVAMVLLGLCDSCIYPSVLGFGMDQLKNVSANATSFLVTCGAIGIPLGTSVSGILGEAFGRTNAMLLGPAFLVLLAVIIFGVQKLHQRKAGVSAQGREHSKKN
ncbi:MFS transporter [Dongshaea marina]|uniref:MFS transporter n=1 Tax=Dongshaea marina TaxID=2047966 RepID=UPI000D3E66BC|nr:MFS transporter [Dongshaea marina]